MKTILIDLSRLPLNVDGVIEEIKCEDATKRRLLDLGLVKGTHIMPVLVSPSKDPRAFSVRGSIIAIRKEDAEHIELYSDMYV